MSAPINGTQVLHWDDCRLSLAHPSDQSQVQQHIQLSAAYPGSSTTECQQLSIGTRCFSTGNSTPMEWNETILPMLCGSLDGKRVWGRMDTCICMAKSLCCSPETITTALPQCHLSYQGSPTEDRKRRERQRRRWLDGITNAMELTWANSGRWWGTGRPGMLRSMRSWRVRHDLATEQQPNPNTR